MTSRNKEQISILTVFSVLAIMITLSPVGLNYNTNIAYAGGNDHDDDDDGNKSNQGIGQNQDNEQNAQCVSRENAIVYCNNLSFQNQVNSGYNVLGQY